MKRLIVSPQAGMCNRFRALCSGLLVARLSGRTVYHCWAAEAPHVVDVDHVRQMRASTWEDFFENDSALPFMAVDETTGIDQVFSEWGPADHWYAVQSSAIRRCFWNGVVDRIGDTADDILATKADTILLETSRCLKPSCLSDEAFESALYDIYGRHFRPLSEYVQAAGRFFRIDPFVAVHIRRGDHLRHVRNARISMHGWAHFIRQKINRSEHICIFSDDVQFAGALAGLLPEYNVEMAADTSLQHAKSPAFIEFLGLSKAARIYGTAGSSFAREAARFGRVRYTECAAVRPAGMAARLLSWCGMGNHPVNCHEITAGL